MKRISLLHKLLVTILGIVIAVSGTMTALFYGFSSHYYRHHAEEMMLQQVTSISYHFNDEAGKELTRDLKKLAASPTIDNYMMSSSIEKDISARSVEKLFYQFIQYEDTYNGISFVDYNGRETVRVSRTGRVRQYRDFSDSVLFHRIEAGPPGNIQVKGPYRNDSGDHLLSVAIRKRDADIGEFGGAIIIEYNLSEFLDYLGSKKIFGVNPVWAYSLSGRLIKRPLGTEAYFEDPRDHLTGTYQREVGSVRVKKGLILYQDLSITESRPLLRIAVTIPSSVLMKDIRAMLNVFLIGFVLSIAFTCVIVYSLSRYLTKPIVRLAQAASVVAKGEPMPEINVHATQEVQLLIDTFSSMADDLKTTTVSRNNVDAVFNSMMNALIVIDLSRKIVRVNTAACMLLDYEESELIGWSFDNILAAHEHKEGGLEDEILSPDRPVRNRKTSYRGKGGKDIPVLFSKSIMYDNTGSIEAFICVAQENSGTGSSESAEPSEASRPPREDFSTWCRGRGDNEDAQTDAS